MTTAVEPVWEQWTRDPILPLKLLTVGDWWALLAHRPYAVPKIGNVSQVPPVWGSVANSANIVDWMAMKLSDDEGIAIAEYADGTNGFYLLTLAATVTATTLMGSIGASWQLITSGTTAAVADGSITTAKLADSSVTSAKIVDGTIQTVDIAPLSITTPLLADGAVTTPKLAPGAVTSSIIANGAVTSAAILDGSIQTADLAPGCVTTTQILDGTIQAIDISSGAVGTPQLAPLSVTTSILADKSVTTAKLADGAVTNQQLALNSVSSGNISDGTIQAADISDRTITEQQMAANSIGTNELISAAVTTAKIANGNVTRALCAPDCWLSPIPTTGNIGQALVVQAGPSIAWKTIIGGAQVNVGPSPPNGPVQGLLWWRNDPDGELFIYYDDGNSKQFVPAVPTAKGDTGPPGPQGPPGDPGTVAYRHIQASAATTWTIPHNLAFRPNVTAVDSTGREITPGDINYTDATHVQLTFSAAVGGEAYLS